MNDEIYVGIDLGTSNSAVAYYDNGKLELLNIRRNKIIPSAIFFEDKNNYIYGTNALKKGKLYPNSIYEHFKRDIGKKDKKTFKYCNSSDKFSKKIYIIDTNIFCIRPYILEDIEEDLGEKIQIIVPYVVYEELGERANDEETKTSALSARESIDNFKESGKIDIIHSNTSLLPEDFFKSESSSNNNKNDNKIISVALKYNDSNTFIITEDKGIRNKVEFLQNNGLAKIKTINEKEFDFQADNDENEISITGKDAAVIFLKFLKNEIEKYTKKLAKKVVVTVPAQFNEIEKEEIKEAAVEAGFEKVIIKPEPVAAAVAYGLEQNNENRFLIYDFGGGTFDIAIIKQEKDEFYVIGCSGDPSLGGKDFTQDIEEFCYELIEEEYQLSLYDESESGLPHDLYMKNCREIWLASEEIKCNLSNSEEYTKTINIITNSSGETRELSIYMTREIFEKLVRRKIDRSIEILDEILLNNNLKRNDIDVVIMAGGTSLIPAIKNTLTEYFGKEPYSDKNPATLIAEGAAVEADSEWNENTTITKKPKIYEKTLTDFGVGLKNHIFDCVISAGSDLPYREIREYNLVQDNQTNLEVKLFNRKKGSLAQKYTHPDVNYTGKVTISQLPPMLVSDVKVEISFEITKEYILDVAVKIIDLNGKIIDSKTVKINKEGK